MKRSEINSKIIQYLKRFVADRIGIFGSFARNEQTPKSDLYILLRFSSTLSLLHLVRIERELSKILGIKVALVTEPSLKPVSVLVIDEKTLTGQHCDINEYQEQG